MILFCEECGTRHSLSQDQFQDNICKFKCHGCNEQLVVSVVDKFKGKAVQTVVHKGLGGNEEIDTKPLKVLVVDDSKIIRRVLRDIIESNGRKQVVGEAENGKEALALLKKTRPDVITLDINMPVMDGLTTLKHIMISDPTPTVMISALTQEGASETFDSLKYGAIDFLPKPSKIKGGDLKSQQKEILRKIDLVTEVQIESIRYLRRQAKEKSVNQKTVLGCQTVLAIGVSEGGYGALLNVVPRLAGDLPAAYVAVMHQAPHHLDAFARYLDSCSQLTVERAVDGMVLTGGKCYLAAAEENVMLIKEGGALKLTAKPSSTPLASHNPIDQLMVSVAQQMKECAAGIILTGTGTDGIKGLGEIIAAKGTAFVQDPKSCLFKETPMLAAEMYAVETLISDKQMAGAINAFLLP